MIGKNFVKAIGKLLVAIGSYWQPVSTNPLLVILYGILSPTQLLNSWIFERAGINIERGFVEEWV